MPVLPAWGHTDLQVQIESLDARLLVTPNDADLLIKRGDLHRRHQDYSAAARDFSAARDLQPDYPLLDFYQGRLLLESGQVSEADRMLSQYLTSHPEHAAAWSLRAAARLDLGQPVKAAQDYGKAILHSGNPAPTLYYSQARALVEGGKELLGQARLVTDAGLAQFPGEVSLLGLGTDIALAEGLPGAAQQYLDRLPAKLLDLPQWRNRLLIKQCFADQLASSGSTESCRIAAYEKLVRSFN
jgi:tetratricopeptide (TPR) repeat protein